jgi:hypothetical protein
MKTDLLCRAFQVVAAAGPRVRSSPSWCRMTSRSDWTACRSAFDDERVVLRCGIATVATLALRLGIEALAGDLVRLRRDRPGAANVARKVMALVYTMVLGADSIDDTTRPSAPHARCAADCLPCPAA